MPRRLLFLFFLLVAAAGQALAQAPTITASAGTTSYTAGAAAVVVDPGATLTVPAGTTITLVWLSSRNSNITAGDVLTFTNNNAALYGNITGVYNTAAHFMDLRSAGNTATPAQWQNAMRAVTLHNNSGAVVAGAHTFRWQATNTAVQSAPQSGQVDKIVNVTVPPVIVTTTWLGNASGAPTDWYTPANWDNGVPTLLTDAVIPQARLRYPVILTGAAQARRLTLVAGCSLILNGGTLELKGDFVNNGAYNSGGGVVLLTGPSVQTVGGSRLTRIVNLTVGPAGATLAGETEIRQLLTLNGNLNTNGQSFTLLADRIGGTPHTAVVVNAGGVVNGTTTVQRYIFAGNAGLGYRHYASPVTGSTVADLQTTGFTPVVNALYNTQGPSVTPFPTVFAYDQARLATPGGSLGAFDKGWVSPAALTDSLTLGRGYTVNISGTQQIVDFVGALHAGPLTVPLARNAGASAADAGWALVGNPYPASIDWSLVAPTQRPNLDAAMYVFESSGPYTGQYRTYSNGIGGSPLIATAQAFFVRVSAGQTSGSLSFEDADRLTTFAAQPTFRRGAADLRPQLQLSLGTATGPRDVAYLYQQAGATPGVDGEFDARKLFNSSGLDLAALSGSDALAINGLPVLTQATAVPLLVRVPAAGQYTLRADNLLHWPAGARAMLLDVQTGQQVDLSLPGASLPVTAAAAAEWTTRFFLNLEPAAGPLATQAPSAGQLALFPNPAQGQPVTLLATGLRGPQAELRLLNGVGQVVRTEPLHLTGQQLRHVLPTVGLPAGVYTLQVRTATGMLTHKLIIH